MMLLLDTHVLLWWLDDPKRLSKVARKAIQDGANPVYMAPPLPGRSPSRRRSASWDAPDNLEDVMEANRFLPLPITIHIPSRCRILPSHHRDPSTGS